MRKNGFGLTLCAMFFALCVSVEAQQSKVYRVGVLLPGVAWYEIIDGLRAGLRELGLEEGKQFVLEIRDTKADLKAAEEAARNFEQEKVNLIYTTRTSVTIAAKRATADILSFSLPGPTRLFSASWRASQNRGEDSQASTTRAPTSWRSAWRS
jgi:ABC-type uncharacterized transport system substrate-binding protein